MYLFNPDQDLALANFTPNYTPPASAIKLAEDLELLPVWFSHENSCIVVQSQESYHYINFLKDILRINVQLICHDEIKDFQEEKIIPWGWNPTLRKKMLDCGVPESKLPTMRVLHLLRNYSNRKHAVEMLEALKSKNSQFCGESHFFTSIEETLEYLVSFRGDKVLKMPLSGSGKGLIWIKGEITDKQTDWCRRVIKNQGGVVAEPFLSKVQDFAMEFYLNHSEIEFAGYSLFQAAASGAYVGNRLMSDRDIEDELSQFVPISVLDNLRNTLLQLLPEYFPEYQGYLGVDMMMCETDDKKYSVQPCVEINMRMNMGIVAQHVYRRFVKPEMKGIFRVEFFKKPPAALQFHQKMQMEYPLFVENGRISAGYLALTAVSSLTNYIAYVLINENGSIGI